MKNRVIIICFVAAMLMYFGFYTDVKEKFNSIGDALSAAFTTAVQTYTAPVCPEGHVQSVDMLTKKPVFTADNKPVCVSILANTANASITTTQALEPALCPRGSYQLIDANNLPMYNTDGTPQCVQNSV